MNILKRLTAILSSYGLSAVLLVLLMVLVFFGTLEQTRIGLYETQRRYFESLFVSPPLLGWLPLPLPGGYLLLALVFVNMLLGAVVRAPKRLARPGLLIAHTGVLYLIAAGFVSYHYAVNGNLLLYEGDSGTRFQSYHDWEIGITEMNAAGAKREFIIPQRLFDDVRGGVGRLFYHAAIPFELRVVRYYPNSRPKRGTGAWAADGVILEPLPADSAGERNVPGVFIRLEHPEQIETATATGILWGMERAPWQLLAAEKRYALSLRRREWAIPFAVKLLRFNHETHPGTRMPSHFSSEVLLKDGTVERTAIIRMNEPLRYKGYTFYQASWGPANAPPGEPLYSVLAVTRNPAGQWPLYASCIISAGLLIHFSQKLLRYLRKKSLPAFEERDEHAAH